jgi:hypothetical protein
MTKVEEKKLIDKVAVLEKQVATLYARLEKNKIDKHVYTVAETSQILECSPQAVYLMISRKELETVKLGHLKVLGESLRHKLGAGSVGV